MPKVLLLILDGWGYKRGSKDNAINLAKTPNFDFLLKKYPSTLLNASGSAVGLPPGFIGNSEVGHLTLGAGRIVESDLVRINKAIKNGSFYKNKVLLDAINHAKKKKQKLHLMGLLSDAGVHSHMDHLFALLKLAQQHQLPEVYVHAFLDGRDTPPHSAGTFIKQLQQKMKQLGVGTLASMMGRYFALDRDHRWAREHKAYDCLVNCKGQHKTDPFEVLQEAYARGETDEFIKPTLFTKKCIVDEDDAVIFFNFRSDRARELTRAFTAPQFTGFPRKEILGLKFVTLTQYEKELPLPTAFPPILLQNTLGEIVSKAGLKQLRIAETEKWAHVTYFFNGLCECIFPWEDRIHISSRRVNTYDQTPRMKVQKITDTLLKNSEKYDFFVVNFANADMVGHTGNLKAAVKAVEAIDTQLGRIVKQFPGTILITADHGNCEDMGPECSTCHTTNQVPLIITKEGKLDSGGLADVAPTILDLFKIKKPKAMMGKSLLVIKN